MNRTTLCLTLAGLLASSAALAQTAPADSPSTPGATTSAPAKPAKQAGTAKHHKKMAHKKTTQAKPATGG